MHKCIKNITDSNNLKLNNKKYNEEYYLLVDGNDFKSYTYLNDSEMLQQISHILVEGGDIKYCSIAAASYLPK